jgi:hypothetical protein
MVQVALSILKPAGSVGATVQLTIAPPELLKVLANATDQVATIGSAITNITFNNSGGAIASCTAAPTLTIAPPELLKVMSVMAESVVDIWSAPVVFVRLGAGKKRHR